MKKIIGLLMLLCCFSIAVPGQNKAGKIGFYVETGYAFDIFVNVFPDYHHHAFNIAVSPGYHVNEKLFVGAGVALYDYRYSTTNVAKYGADIKINSNFVSVPVYAHGIWKFGTDGDPAFFLSLKAGYGIISKSMNPMKGNDASYKIMRDYSGGLYLSPSIGYKYPLNNKHALSLSASYDHQDYTITSEVSDKVNKNNKNNSTIALKVGWMF